MAGVADLQPTGGDAERRGSSEERFVMSVLCSSTRRTASLHWQGCGRHSAAYKGNPKGGASFDLGELTRATGTDQGGSPKPFVLRSIFQDADLFKTT